MDVTLAEAAPKRSRLIAAVSALLLILGSAQASAHGLFHYAGNVPQFLLGIGVMAVGYVLSWRLLVVALAGAWVWGVAIVSRLLFLPMYPGSDIWRYLWEGYLQLQGLSPYEHAPNAPELMAYRTGWWPLINNADVSAIYPPITQLGFRLLAALSHPGQGDVDLDVLGFKLAFVAADLAVCGLLWRRFGGRSLLYAWNPLVIYSFAGGGHYDSWLVLPLVAAWLLARGDATAAHTEEAIGTGGGLRMTLQAFLIGISIGVKWITLPVLAFLGWRSWRCSGWVTALLVGAVGLLPVGLAALTYCDSVSCPLVPTSSSFVVNARTAEFLPYIIGAVWPASLESNRLLAIPLALVTLVLLLRNKSLGAFTLNYLIALVVLSPIVHAWYLTWLVPFTLSAQGVRNWGPIVGSLSVFVYFVWTGQQVGDFEWFLHPWERWAIWGPFVAGLGWTTYRRRTEG